MALAQVLINTTNGQPMVVRITRSSGGTPAVYADATATTTTSMPATITSPTTFFVPAPETYVISVKDNGVEVATSTNTALTQYLTEGVVLAFTPTPSPTTAQLVATGIPSVTVTANYSMSLADEIVLANGTSLTITLPSAVAVGAGGAVRTVKNINASPATLASAAGTVEGYASVALTQNVSYSVVSDGSNWFVV